MMELVPVTIVGAFTCGTCLALLGSIKLPLAKRLGIGEGRVGLLLAALNLALIPGMLLAGVLIDIWGLEWVLIGGALLAAVALTCLAVSQSYRAAVGSVLLMGASIAGVSTGCSVLMPAAFFPDNPAASANLGNVFFGLGALITSALFENLLQQPRLFRRTMLILALLALVPAVVAAMTSAQAYPVSQPGNLGHVLSSPILWLAGLVFFLYGPLEGALGTWATTYLTEMGHSERRAAWLLSGFWLAFLAARLLTAVLQENGILPHHSEAWLIVILALASGVALGNLAGTSDRPSAAWGLLLVGAFFGPIFPTLVGIVFDQFKNEHGTAFGAMFAIGGTGSLILAPLVGFSARHSTVQRTLRIPTVVALVLAAVALVLALSL